MLNIFNTIKWLIAQLNCFLSLNNRPYVIRLYVLYQITELKCLYGLIIKAMCMKVSVLRLCVVGFRAYEQKTDTY
jgi:hypothetical protein